ncbi:FG-GAP repeat domain-containing protein [Streptomyces odontomachi]|uniref:FG-GAP repeat domain-containing protein n=1 Tax=Streptomyces odontomachi TaxID=2944940 RepID=UPI00210D0400|nr:VCBS repeat-containing protein [Streptomyces sp. ODS25]
MNLRKAAGGIGLMAAIAVSLSVTAPAASAQPTSSDTTTGAELQDDFNGDGYSDVAFPVPAAGLKSYEGNQDGGGAAYDGYVAVMYGSADGLQTSSKQVFDQEKPGIPGDAAQGDAYGSSVTSADLDQDGYADLIVGAGGDDGGRGSLSVIWGGPDGLSDSTWLAQGDAYDDGIGHLAEAGDFNGDGTPDVVTSFGDTGLHVLTGPFDRTGAPAGGTRAVDGPAGDDWMTDLAAGDVNGDGVTDLVSTTGRDDASRVAYWAGSPDGLTAGASVSGLDGAGDNLDVGDVNGDHHADIVIGRPDGNFGSENPLPAAKGGMVTYVPGSADGPVPAGATRINQDTAGVPGVAEEDEADGSCDQFGAGVSVGDIDGDGYADVSVGVRAETYDDIEMTGAAVTLRGTADGLTGAGAQVFSEDTAGVPGIPQAWDFFGSATKLTDTDGDGMADLVVGASGEGESGDEDTTDGSIWVLKATADGVTPDGSFTFGVRTLGVPAHNGGGLGSEFAS